MSGERLPVPTPEEVQALCDFARLAEDLCAPGSTLNAKERMARHDAALDAVLLTFGRAPIFGTAPEAGTSTVVPDLG